MKPYPESIQYWCFQKQIFTCLCNLEDNFGCIYNKVVYKYNFGCIYIHIPWDRPHWLQWNWVLSIESMHRIRLLLCGVSNCKGGHPPPLVAFVLSLLERLAVAVNHSCVLVRDCSKCAPLISKQEKDLCVHISINSGVFSLSKWAGHTFQVGELHVGIEITAPISNKSYCNTLKI